MLFYILINSNFVKEYFLKDNNSKSKYFSIILMGIVSYICIHGILKNIIKNDKLFLYFWIILAADLLVLIYNYITKDNGNINYSTTHKENLYVEKTSSSENNVPNVTFKINKKILEELNEESEEEQEQEEEIIYDENQTEYEQYDNYEPEPDNEYYQPEPEPEPEPELRRKVHFHNSNKSILKKMNTNTDSDIINSILLNDKNTNKLPDNNNINPDPNFTFEINLEKNVDTIQERERDINGQFNINTKTEEIKNKYENNVENLLKERAMLNTNIDKEYNKTPKSTIKNVTSLQSDTELDLNINDFNNFLK